jgi:hypothetical protein
MAKRGSAILIMALTCLILIDFPVNGYSQQKLDTNQNSQMQKQKAAQELLWKLRRQHIGLLVIADLSVSPLNYTGRCPALFTFTGKITVTRATSIQYKFIRTDSFQTEPITLTFEGPGTQEVTHTWQLGDATSLPTFGESVAMELVYPLNRKIRSNTVIIRGSCTDQP